MRLLWVSNIINLISILSDLWLDRSTPGVTGAALATLIGEHRSSLPVLSPDARTERLRILRSQVRLNFGVLLRLVRVSLTGILQFAIAHTSWIGWCASSASRRRRPRRLYDCDSHRDLRHPAFVG